MKKLPNTIDARVWAKEFIKTVKKYPDIPTDMETMVGWFANAIMAGVDESQRRIDSIVKNMVK